MNHAEHHIAFGPVPSRRLGWSLGVNNIPAKTCSYACLYCQVGPTTDPRIEPRRFFAPEEIHERVAAHLHKVQSGSQQVDYLTFVPDGEPTLDARLGESIAALRGLGIPIAVITNATLLWREDVRSRLRQADLVSVKVDSVDEAIWRKINRPLRDLELGVILRGIREFAAEYSGALISETMLVAGLNDSRDALIATAEFLADIAPRTAYLAVPTRPPTVEGVKGPNEAGLTRAYQSFLARLPSVELLTGHETGRFVPSGDARQDLLAITAVHPMREVAVRQLLADNHADWTLIETLLVEGELKKVMYAGEQFYLRRPARSL